MVTPFHVMQGRLTSRRIEKAVDIFRERPDDCTLGPLLIGTAIPLQAWLQSLLRHDFKFVCFSEVFRGPFQAPSTIADVYIDKVVGNTVHNVVVADIIGQIRNYAIDTGRIVMAGAGTCIIPGLHGDDRQTHRIPDAQLAPTRLVPADGNGLCVPRLVVQVDQHHVGLAAAMQRAAEYFHLPQLRTVLMLCIGERSVETGEFGALAVVYARRRNNELGPRQARSIGTAALSPEALAHVPEAIQALLPPHDARLPELIADGYFSWPASMGPAPTITVAATDVFYESPGRYLGQLPPDLAIDLFHLTALIATVLPPL
ncbi:hypothetical protein SPRG_07934 [Saprolegnia parasitica CBS 223.65]|uniref:Uncharacterized protein n=1 Tax=Saprolegnia parasitica (strain CBS 223.65) TaxID=695850 RepID=A0A067CI86_SAPPC|nr:hypothetical protein SPRG_07934 [Saprolegnia parasitica CBS 223.65]KDO26532.1 hypothetical protein SPRG_07934 [Saprolegnia parasitica CBS 223.65]|eukprot:XP_012202675.1 hypothetical protein SPRG_07934 [Saprolegnia parasitica CBS 223.65]